MPPGLMRLPNGKLVPRPTTQGPLLSKPTYSTQAPKGRQNDPFFSVPQFAHSVWDSFSPKGIVKSAVSDFKAVKKGYNFLNTQAGRIPGVKPLAQALNNDPVFQSVVYGKQPMSSMRDPRTGKQLPLNLGMVDPSGISRLLQEGRSGVYVAEDLAKSLSRIRPGGGVHVVQGPSVMEGGRFMNERGFAHRVPWVVNKKTGEIFIGQTGETHRALAARMLNTRDSGAIGNLLTNTHQPGFMYLPPGSGRAGLAGAPGHIDFEWGDFTRQPHPANLEPSRRFLEMLIGQSHNSPYELKHFFNPAVRGNTPLMQAEQTIQQGPDAYARAVARLKAARMKHGYRP